MCDACGMMEEKSRGRKLAILDLVCSFSYLQAVGHSTKVTIRVDIVSPNHAADAASTDLILGDRSV